MLPRDPYARDVDVDPNELARALAEPVVQPDRFVAGEIAADPSHRANVEHAPSLGQAHQMIVRVVDASERCRQQHLMILYHSDCIPARKSSSESVHDGSARPGTDSSSELSTAE